MTITATFENGVLKPDQALDLPDRAKVRITIEPVKSDIQKEWDATREERLAARQPGQSDATPIDGFCALPMTCPTLIKSGPFI